MIYWVCVFTLLVMNFDLKKIKFKHDSTIPQVTM